MGFFNKMFAKKKAEVKTMSVNSENRDKMEAMIGGALLVAYADGNCDDDEMLSIDAQIKADPTLASFGSEIADNMSKFNDMLTSNFLMGKIKVLREIADCTNDKEAAEEILVFIIGVAAADGEVDTKELEMLKLIAEKLNLRITDYYTE